MRKLAYASSKSSSLATGRRSGCYGGGRRGNVAGVVSRSRSPSAAALPLCDVDSTFRGHLAR
ncbi:hypothetical protein PIB30_100059, partial [Stylosanthes scabra]|nr:hypothetical protein [Stylosanthes scabra]